MLEHGGQYWGSGSQHELMTVEPFRALHHNLHIRKVSVPVTGEFISVFMYLRAIFCTFQISVDFYYVPVGGRGVGRGGTGEVGEARERGIECILYGYSKCVNCTCNLLICSQTHCPLQYRTSDISCSRSACHISLSKSLPHKILLILAGLEPAIF